MTTLLLAESHLPTLEHLVALLSQAGYEVRAVREPSSVMEQFFSVHPDLVVLAVDFPRLEGAHVGRLIRTSDQGARIPIVAIDKGHLGKAKGVSAVFDLKVDAYLMDPLKTGELTQKVEALLGAARASAHHPTSGVQVTLGRPPVTSGELRGHALPAVIHANFRLRRDGILVVAYRELTRRVFFSEGAPVNYDSTARQDALPSFLLERKVLTEAQADLLLGELRRGARIGVALGAAGVEAEGEDLLQLLRDYVQDRLAQVVGMREGRYAFYAGREFLEGTPSVEVPALSPILAAARRSFSLKSLTAPLRPHLGEYPVRSADFSKDLAAYGLGTEDLKRVMQVNGRLALRDLLTHGRGDLREGASLFWYLQLTGGLCFEKRPVASAQTHSLAPDVIAPRKRKALPAEVASALREAAVKIITGSYFRGLGLDITADTDDVERAYHEAAARFHPDTYAEYDLSELVDLLGSVQDRLLASYRVLSIEEKRKGYLQYLFSRMDAGRATAIQVDAEIALRRGEGALKRKDFTSAVKAFEEAVSFNPREPEYYSYLAWATYLGASGAPKERARSAQKVLKKALSLNPYLERGLIISAIIDNESGDAPAARKKLLKVLELNPHSQLAKAALRKVGR